VYVLFQIIYLCYCYYRSNKLVLYDIIMRSVKMKKRDSLKAISFFLPKISVSAQNLFEHGLGANIAEAFDMHGIVF
jgi:hypothetical protein